MMWLLRRQWVLAGESIRKQINIMCLLCRHEWLDEAPIVNSNPEGNNYETKGAANVGIGTQHGRCRDRG